MRSTKQLAAFVAAFVTVGGAAAPLVAHADAKYNRKTKDIKVDQTDRTKKLEAKAPEAAGPAPDITADKFFQIEAQVQGDFDVLIAEYKDQLSDREANDPQRVDIGFRLAEAYSQKQRYHHSLAMEALNKADKTADAGAKAKLKSDSDAEKKQETDALKLAISAYHAVTDNPNFVKFPQADEVVFYYAFTLQQAGYLPQAGDIYKLLLKNFQGSRFVPDAYLYFADRYFENRDLGNAEAFYTKVEQFPKSPLYPYAVYKLGWTHYNQKRLPDAMKEFKETITLTNGNKLYEPMNKTAKKDFVRVYAESDAPVNVAYNAFKGIDASDYSFKMLGFLGAYYIDEGKADKAIFTFHQMIATKPKDPLVCEWQYNVVRATNTTGTNADKVRELSNIVKLYTALKKGGGLPAQTLQECRENAAGVTGELAMLWHAEGLKTLNFATLGDAEALYKVYLENFPDADNVIVMQVNYAELLWNRATMEKDPKMAPKRWEAAAAEHSKVVQMKGIDEAQRKESAYATVLAWKNALAVDPATDVGTDEKPTEAVPKPEPIPEKEQKMLDAFNVYLTYIKDKKDEERVQILFFTGRMYWRHKHFDEAIKYLSEVVNEHPEHEYAEVAFNVLLDSLNQAHRHDELLDWVKRTRENQKLLTAHPAIKASIDILWLQGLRKQAEALEKDGRYKECGYAYDRLQREYPNDPKINEILFNAALCFKRAKLIGYAIRFRTALTERPNASTDPLAQKAQLLLGDDFTSIAFYDKAADMYEAYAAKFSAEKDAPQALSYATFYRKGLGQDDKAIKDTETYVHQFTKADTRDAAGAEYTIANIYEKNKETDKFIGHLESYIKTWGDKGGVDLEIAAHVRAGEALWKASCPVKGENGSCIEIKRERALRDTSGKKKKGHVAQTQCGSESKNKITIFARKADAVKRAQAHFQAAIDEWKKQGPGKIAGKDEGEKAAHTADAIRYVAEAQFYLAEQRYEAFLDTKFPTNLNFDPGKPAKLKDSQARFGKYFDDKTKFAGEVNAKYRAIVDTALSGGININAAQWAIAAAARMGQVLQNFSDALFTAEIPKDVQAYEDAVDAYCDELTNRADPLEKSSIDAFSFCLSSSNKLSWFNEWSQLCESELAQIRPQDFPAAGEIRSTPDNVAVSLDTQPIVSDLAIASQAAAGPSAAATSAPPAPAAKTPATPAKKAAPAPKKKGRH